MAVAPEDFRVAKGHYLSLDALKTDADGWITAIVVTLDGIVGSDSTRDRYRRMQYRVLASVQSLQAALPTIWIVSPRDSVIRHMNIFRAREYCPLVGERLPELCWGNTTAAQWLSAPPAQRTLANLFEAARQVLSNANPDSRAR
jgi:hypothetical protein